MVLLSHGSPGLCKSIKDSRIQQHKCPPFHDIVFYAHYTSSLLRCQHNSTLLLLFWLEFSFCFCGFSLFLLRYQVKQKAFSDFHILISENAKKNCHIRFLQYSSFLIFLFTSYVKIPVPHSQLNGSVRRSFHSYHCSLFRFFYLLQCF